MKFIVMYIYILIKSHYKNFKSLKATAPIVKRLLINKRNALETVHLKYLTQRSIIFCKEIKKGLNFSPFLSGR